MFKRFKYTVTKCSWLNSGSHLFWELLFSVVSVLTGAPTDIDAPYKKILDRMALWLIFLCARSKIDKTMAQWRGQNNPCKYCNSDKVLKAEENPAYNAKQWLNLLKKWQNICFQIWSRSRNRTLYCFSTFMDNTRHGRNVRLEFYLSKEVCLYIRQVSNFDGF